MFFLLEFIWKLEIGICYFRFIRVRKGIEFQQIRLFGRR
ncbi:Uncharacterized protein dnm_072580 [Desulfonema magnum]|uniref:Uncharacterized protein n=1 Tax=Desulfonema magnum TaxID=45655 RepID=A0A975BT85_9BACT|nr:Uncharacterized protein dnm_072580 [Desulfonema magnum]